MSAKIKKFLYQHLREEKKKIRFWESGFCGKEDYRGSLRLSAVIEVICPQAEEDLLTKNIARSLIVSKVSELRQTGETLFKILHFKMRINYNRKVKIKMKFQYQTKLLNKVKMIKNQKIQKEQAIQFKEDVFKDILKQSLIQQSQDLHIGHAMLKLGQLHGAELYLKDVAEISATFTAENILYSKKEKEMIELSKENI